LFESKAGDGSLLKVKIQVGKLLRASVPNLSWEITDLTVAYAQDRNIDSLLD
jgi:hypothetical protein